MRTITINIYLPPTIQKIFAARKLGPFHHC